MSVRSSWQMPVLSPCSEIPTRFYGFSQTFYKDWIMKYVYTNAHFSLLSKSLKQMLLELFPPPQTDLGVSRPDMNLFLWQVTFVWSIRRTQIDAHILWDMKVRPALVIIHVFNCGREQKKQTKCDVKESCSIWIYAGQRNYLTY